MRTPALLSAFLLLVSAPALANDSVPLDEYGLRVPPTPGLEVQDDHISKILFLNRCAAGCVIEPGPNDARYNTSSIVRENTAFISAWGHGNESWEALVQCVKDVYAPYDVVVTDVDPGDNVFHHEAIVAGTWDEIHYDQPVGGVAPSQCNPANNVISFTFANGYGNSPLAICSTVAQETAHSYGLEHAFDCSDPMTYLNACGRQFFRDATTPCGEYDPLNQCLCGGNAQNSHRWLKSVLGESTNPPPGPTIEFLNITEGEQVTAGFEVAVEALHMRGILQVQLFVNGTPVDSVDGHAWSNADDPYWLKTPSDLADGIIDLRLVAQNDIGTASELTLTVQKGEPCTSADQCNEGQECSDGRCYFPLATGELGASCADSEECVSGLCPKQGEVGYCSQECFPTPTENTCPDGFHCVGINATDGVCWPNEGSEEGGCGCQSGTSSGIGGLLVVLALLRRRRD